MAWRRPATSHYLNQWWLDHWRIYTSLGLNELMDIWNMIFTVYHYWSYRRKQQIFYIRLTEFYPHFTVNVSDHNPAYPSSRMLHFFHLPWGNCHVCWCASWGSRHVLHIDVTAEVIQIHYTCWPHWGSPNMSHFYVLTTGLNLTK